GVMGGEMGGELVQAEYSGSAVLRALEVWRAPLLTLAFLYQASLIALNRESAGVRLLLVGAAGSVPMVALLRWGFGLPGAAVASIVTGLALACAGYWRLSREGRAPAWHHHLARPALASGVMVAAGLALGRQHVLVGVLGGAVAYGLALLALGGLRSEDVRVALGRG